MHRNTTNHNPEDKNEEIGYPLGDQLDLPKLVHHVPNRRLHYVRCHYSPALALALENALRLNKLDAQYRDAMTQQSQLQQNVVALEQALEKLRQLSLQ